MSDLAKTTGPGSVAALPTKTSFLPLKQCETLEQAFKTQEFQERIAASVPQHIQPQRMLRTFVQAVSRTPLLAQASVRSFVGACLSLSQVGLEPNTPLGHAYLIPFKSSKWNPNTRQREEGPVEINVIFGYPGLLDLSFRSRLVRSVHADVVWPGDSFSFEYGSDAHLRHTPRGHKPDEVPVWAYMHAVLADGQAFEVLPYSDVLAIRNRSQAYRSAADSRDRAQEKGWKIPASFTEAPWVAHEIAMARKTAFRAGSKWLPRSVELASAIALDEAQERRRSIDFGAVLDAPLINGTQDYLSAAVDLAQEPEGEPDLEGTATFTDRRPTEPPTRTDTTRLPITADNADNRRKPPPRFEAILIDSLGEPLEGPPLSSPRAFAQAFMMLWREHDLAEDSESIDALIHYNADSLDEVRKDPEAAAMLAETEAEDDRQTKSLPVAVSPRIERGKISWPGYIRDLQADLERTSDDALRAWAEVNRITLTSTPLAQRLLGIRALADRMGSAGITPPGWLGEMMRPAKSETTDDDRWVEQTVEEVGQLTTREAFAAYVNAPAVQRKMSALQRENRPLFDRADAAFLAKHKALPEAGNGGGQ